MRKPGRSSFSWIKWADCQGGQWTPRSRFNAVGLSQALYWLTLPAAVTIPVTVFAIAEPNWAGRVSGAIAAVGPRILPDPVGPLPSGKAPPDQLPPIPEALSPLSFDSGRGGEFRCLLLSIACIATLQLVRPARARTPASAHRADAGSLNERHWLAKRVWPDARCRPQGPPVPGSRPARQASRSPRG